MLPETLDPDALRTAAVVVLVVLLVVAFLVARFIHKMALRVVVLGALAGLALFVWVQRDELRDCVPACACTFLGYEVQVEGCRTDG